jgi:NitT/TauT family transport system substrate-binding protein
MSRKTRYATAAVAAALALLAAVYAWTSRTPLGAAPRSLEAVTIAANTAYAGTCPIFIAQANGYFAAEGVAAALQPYTSGKAALDATLEGRANLGTVADVPIVFAVLKNQPVSVVATIFTAEKDHGIVARKDRGIVAAANLKGKRIGVTRGTTGHFLMEAFLNRQRISMGEVTVRNLKPEELSGALVKGEVDAVATWEPYLGAMVEELGGNGAVFYGEGIYELAFNLAATREYVASHPEAITRVLKALTRGARFCQDEPDAAREIVAKAMSADSAKLKALWPSYRFRVSLDQSLLLALEDETRWAIKNKLTERREMPNYLNHVHLDALRAVTPAAVTIIH